VHEAERDEGGDQERLVGRRIEERAERRLRVREARDGAVEPVRDAGGDEHGERLAVAEGLEQDEERGGRDDAEGRREVRDRGDHPGCGSGTSTCFRSWPATFGGTSAVTVTMPSR